MAPMFFLDMRMNMKSQWIKTQRGALLELFAAASLLCAASAHAVIFQSTADPAFNTTSPTGALANSGWELQGAWGDFLGTPVAPQYFLAAQHVGGYIGQVFTFRGVEYITTAVFDDPYSDLRLWKVDNTFPAYAQLYTGNNELGRDMVVFGRGTRRGAEVSVSVESKQYFTNTVDIRKLSLALREAKKLYPNASFRGNNMTTISAVMVTNTIVNGWHWGAPDGVMRWGKQKVGDTFGNWLMGLFAPSSDPTSCHLSGGDSSGAIFINDDTGWKLAGINYGVEGPYQVDLSTPEFEAAIIDKSGLFRAGAYFLADGTPKPTAFYCSRVSASVSWIRSITGQ
jgi:hypothetical protein